MSDAPDHEDAPLDDTPLRPGGSVGARTLTRWIGTGIGAAMLITVLSLAFSNPCVTSAQSYVLSVVLALGAALLLWGVVGGLQIDVKLKFKALGEVAAAGVAGIFLVVLFVFTDGVVPAKEGCGQELAKVEKHVLRGRVHEAGDITASIEGAVVTIDLPDGIKNVPTDADGVYSKLIDGDVGAVQVWAKKAGYEDTEIVDVGLPLASGSKIVLEMTKVSGGQPTKPKVPIERIPLDRANIEKKPSFGGFPGRP